MTNGRQTRHGRALLGMLGAAVVATWAGCATPPPSPKDMQWVENASKTEMKIAQQTIAELRAELQGAQHELGLLRAAQAKGEGETRDTQRRLMEEQRTVIMQRDELARLRDERDRSVQSSAALQSQLVELGQLRQQLTAMTERGKKRAPEGSSKGTSTRKAVPPAKTVVGVPAPQEKPTPEPASGQGSRTVIVARGDTLSELAQKYRVSLAAMKALNHLDNEDHIEPGQELLLPESPRRG